MGVGEGERGEGGLLKVNERGLEAASEWVMESYQSQHLPSQDSLHHFTDQETEDQNDSVAGPRLVAGKSGLLGLR